MSVNTIYLSVAAGFMVFSFVKNRQKTGKALIHALRVALLVLPVLLFIFVLMGLMEVYVPRRVFVAMLGSGHGVLGIIIGELLGAFALIEPAAVFPFAGFLRQNGATYGAVVGFVMSAILIGVVTLPLELNQFGMRFTVARNIVTLVLVFAMGIVFMVVPL
jgi:uncharacterized membrane protein YraQ (UPF0718 family)